MKHTKGKCPECGKPYLQKRVYPKEKFVLYVHEMKKGFMGIIELTETCHYLKAIKKATS